jgi:hypothetical protein
MHECLKAWTRWLYDTKQEHKTLNQDRLGWSLIGTMCKTVWVEVPSALAIRIWWNEWKACLTQWWCMAWFTMGYNRFAYDDLYGFLLRCTRILVFRRSCKVLVYVYSLVLWDLYGVIYVFLLGCACMLVFPEVVECLYISTTELYDIQIYMM